MEGPSAPPLAPEGLASVLRRVCSFCQREATEAGWVSAGSQHGSDDITHGICPDCERTLWRREFGLMSEPSPVA